ncbi:MAG: hypothetical protein R3323_09855 [Wenzhouxiangellaceae bacterium]|nr:hypothetical protein [Wenzhouxiangellaceae bacterium]
MQDLTHGTQSVGNWMVTLLITFIPIVNIVMLLVWAFGSSTHPEKANWAKAMLAWFAIFIVLSGLMALLGGAAG